MAKSKAHICAHMLQSRLLRVHPTVFPRSVLKSGDTFTQRSAVSPRGSLASNKLFPA